MNDDARSTARRFAPLAVGAAALGFIALTRPEVITGSFGTVESTFRVLGLLVAFALVVWLVRRFVTNERAAKAITWGLGGALLFVAVVPAYIDEEVNEDLATTAADLGLEEAPSPSTTEPPIAGAAAEAPDDTVAPTTTEAPAEPVKVTTGQLSGLAGHRGSGEAAVYRLADGTDFVRLEDFEVSNGPGIEVWVIPRAGAESPDGGTKLADLPGNTGSFNAAIPVEFDTSGDVTVLLWCNPVATPMAHATQSPA
jgi:hypothetical protein